MKLRPAPYKLLADNTGSCQDSGNTGTTDRDPLHFIQQVSEVREIEVIVLLSEEPKHISTNVISDPVLGHPVTIAVNESGVA